MNQDKRWSDNSDGWERDFWEDVSKYTKNIKWSPDTSEYTKTLIVGNINGFAGHILKSLGNLPKKLVSETEKRVRDEVTNDLENSSWAKAFRAMVEEETEKRCAEECRDKLLDEAEKYTPAYEPSDAAIVFKLKEMAAIINPNLKQHE